LDIICVDTPSGKVAEMSSSYDLSIFSSRADPKCVKIVEVVSGGSSLSIGELWPDIDKLDEIRHEDTSIVHIVVGNQWHQPRGMIDVLGAVTKRLC
jgi:hypothetical protein